MESIVLPFSYEDKQEELSLKVYSDLLKTTFKSIAWQVWKKDFEQKIFCIQFVKAWDKFDWIYTHFSQKKCQNFLKLCDYKIILYI